MDPFLVTVQLESYDYVLFQQEVLEVFEGNAVAETFPGWEAVLVLSVSDGALQPGVVFSGQDQHFSNNLSLSFLVLSGSDLVEHRQQEYNFIPLIQQEESVILDILKLLIILSQPLTNFIIVGNFTSFYVLVALLNLSIEHISFEIIFLVVFDKTNRVVNDLLLFFELAGVDDDQILAQVQFAHILAETTVHGQGKGQFLLHLLLKVAGDFMLEELLPAHSIFGVGPEHLPDELFAHVGDVVDSSREVKIFLVDHNFEFVDVFGVEGGSGY